MKKNNFFAILLLLVIVCQTSVIRAQDTGTESFVGSWALTLEYESSSAGWFEIRQEEGYLDADVLWRWGSVYPADFVFKMDNQLFITKARKVVRTVVSTGRNTS